MVQAWYPTISQNGYGSATVGLQGYTNTLGANYSSLFCGSSKYVVDKKIKRVKTKNIVKNFELPIVDNSVRKYKLNIGKVRKKAIAFSQLYQSKKFFAFYSISFPPGLSEDQIWQIHNTVLTRLRKLQGDFSYLWVAERQANGNPHFHMLTNSYFNVNVVNHYYKAAITNTFNADMSVTDYPDTCCYNGVDVARVYSPTGVSKYMSKYITKSTATFSHLPYNSSLDVSALFTGAHSTSDYSYFIRHSVIHRYSGGQVSVMSSTFNNIYHVHFNRLYSGHLVGLMLRVNQKIYDNDIEGANVIILQHYVINEGWKWSDNAGAVAPKFQNEDIHCIVTQCYNQHELDLGIINFKKKMYN